MPEPTEHNHNEPAPPTPESSAQTPPVQDDPERIRTEHGEKDTRLGHDMAKKIGTYVQYPPGVEGQYGGSLSIDREAAYYREGLARDDKKLEGLDLFVEADRKLARRIEALQEERLGELDRIYIETANYLGQMAEVPEKLYNANPEKYATMSVEVFLEEVVRYKMLLIEENVWLYMKSDYERYIGNAQSGIEHGIFVRDPEDYLSGSPEYSDYDDPRIFKPADSLPINGNDAIYVLGGVPSTTRRYINHIQNDRVKELRKRMGDKVGKLTDYVELDPYTTSPKDLQEAYLTTAKRILSEVIIPELERTLQRQAEILNKPLEPKPDATTGK